MRRYISLLSNRRNALALTARAIEGRALTEAHSANFCATVLARLTLPCVDHVLLLEIAGRTVRPEEITQTAAPGADRVSQCLLDCHHQCSASLQTQAASFGAGIDSRAKQCLVGVNVSNSGNNVAIHQRRFDGDATSPGVVVQPACIEAVFQGLRAKAAKK